MKLPRLPKLPEFTRETKTVALAVLSATFLALAVALVLPIVGLYHAHARAEVTIIDARAAAQSDQIRAMGFYRADTSATCGAELVLELRRIEGASR